MMPQMGMTHYRTVLLPIQAHFSELIAANTVNGRLLVLPAELDEGVLFYRVDLVRKYGYRAPPKTWEELEVMARRIQSGERATGTKISGASPARSTFRESDL
jgi:trehalose/maltose transport system substrate-binding protein